MDLPVRVLLRNQNKSATTTIGSDHGDALGGLDGQTFVEAGHLLEGARLDDETLAIGKPLVAGADDETAPSRSS